MTRTETLLSYLSKQGGARIRVVVLLCLHPVIFLSISRSAYGHDQNSNLLEKPKHVLDATRRDSLRSFYT